MDSPSSSTTGDTNKVQIKSSPSSIVESLRGCGISGGICVDKEELRKKLTMPQYLRFAMRDSIRFKDLTIGESRCINDKDNDMVVPLTPMVIFVNPGSGGRHGPIFKERFQHLMSDEQVLDVLYVKPYEFIKYGLGCLETLASLGDFCAKETHEKIRIMVAGGDGTVGWVLGCLAELHAQGREPIPLVGIIPLGIGNDLSRSFGWGGSFPFSWKAVSKRFLYKGSIGPICHLDSWRVSLSMLEGTVIEPPHSLKHTIAFTLDEGLEVEGEL